MCQLLKERHRWKLVLSKAERITLQEVLRHHPHPDARERAAALRHPWQTAPRRIG